jgi:hypothetical protein
VTAQQPGLSAWRFRFRQTVGELSINLSAFRELRPIGSKPKPRLSIDRPHGAFGILATFLSLMAKSVCV